MSSVRERVQSSPLRSDTACGPTRSPVSRTAQLLLKQHQGGKGNGGRRFEVRTETAVRFRPRRPLVPSNNFTFCHIEYLDTYT
jgi:hypothetical protein